MTTGRVVRFDESRGYGFIAPDDGGDDVFVHANELTIRGVRVGTGTRVRFSVIDGGRGPKAYDVVLVDDRPGATGDGASTQSAAEPAEKTRRTPADDELCEVFTEVEFVRRTTELLLEAGPELTGAQILRLRQALVRFARGSGWVD